MPKQIHESLMGAWNAEDEELYNKVFDILTSNFSDWDANFSGWDAKNLLKVKRSVEEILSVVKTHAKTKT